MPAGSNDGRIRRLSARRTLAALVALAFVLRLVVRMVSGRDEFEAGSYDFYRWIAESVLDGRGFCMFPDGGCAIRPPIYPLLLVPLLATIGLFPALVIVQAAIGAALVWAVFALARELFSDRVALVAAGMAAVSPYAVVHDTALQETVVVNCLTVVATFLLVRYARRHRVVDVCTAGAVLAIATLTTARVATFIPCVLVWLVCRRHVPLRRRVTDAMAFCLPVVVLIGGWVVRNDRVVGAPVLTTESGLSLWIGNNASTFEFYPERSVDFIASSAFEKLGATDVARFEALEMDPVGRDRLARDWAVAYMTAHPVEIIVGWSRKLWVVLSAQMSPSRSARADVGYRGVYGALNLCALAGLWTGRRRGGPVFAMLAGFAITTAVYWSHTSHKSVIDGLLFVYAASGVWLLASTIVPRIASHNGGASA